MFSYRQIVYLLDLKNGTELAAFQLMPGVLMRKSTEKDAFELHFVSNEGNKLD